MSVIFFFRIVASGSSYDTTQGLWKTCASGEGQQACADLSCSGDVGGGICSKILAGRAFMTLACLTSAFAVMCFIVSVVMTDGKRSIILIIGKVLIPICFLMGLIGVATGIVGSLGGGKLGDQVKLGPGSIIGIIALILNFFAIVGSIITK